MDTEKPTMTTYKMADASMVNEEFGWVTDLEYFEDEEEPTEVIEEVWVLKSSRTITVGPQCSECGDPATHWGLCEKHARIDDPESFRFPEPSKP